MHVNANTNLLQVGTYKQCILIDSRGAVLEEDRVYCAHRHTVYTQVHTSTPRVIKEASKTQQE